MTTPGGMYVRVQTLACPRCGQSGSVLMTRAEYTALHNHTGPIQETLRRFHPDVRERFLSGYCPECWDILFKIDDEDDE